MNDKFLYLVTSIDFIEESPNVIVNTKEEAINWINDNKVEDRSYYYYKVPYINSKL